MNDELGVMELELDASENTLGMESFGGSGSAGGCGGSGGCGGGGGCNGGSGGCRGNAITEAQTKK
ncbi:hypothetical protein ACLUUI_05055 [Enterobacterales bacterium AW_CKDN230030176-1A_HGKHYDSX7]